MTTTVTDREWDGHEPPLQFARRAVLAVLKHGTVLVVTTNNGGNFSRALFAQAIDDLAAEGSCDPADARSRVRFVTASRAGQFPEAFR